MVRVVNDIYTNIRILKQTALENGVPIMMDDGIDFLTSLILRRNVKTVLEIGTAVGYSAIMMALSSPDLKIVSIEKNRERYMEAIKNIKKFDLEDRITLIYKDALDVKLKEKFDLIFIDAAKSKNLDIFNRFENNLNDNGAIVTDNINFHGYVMKNPDDIESRNIRQLVRKIKNYIFFLQDNVKYKTVFFDVGDGIAVTEKRSSKDGGF